LDGLVLNITDNLREALLAFGKNDFSSATGENSQIEREPLIWIDAVCINQEDVAEKSSQVAMMDQIYSAAQNVIVWLGINDWHTTAAIEVMKSLESVPSSRLNVKFSDLEDEEAYNALGIEYIDPQDWLDYAAFLQRTWFCRIWVVQEAFMARNLIVLLGSHILHWPDITACAKILRITNLGSLLVEAAVKAIDAEAQTGTVYVNNTLTNQYILEKMRDTANSKDATSLNLEDLLWSSRYFQATNAKDHIFALLGVWKRFLGNEKIPAEMEANYKNSLATIFTNAAWELIRETKDLNILSLVGDPSSRPNPVLSKDEPNLPSWVPDFSTGCHPSPLSGSPRSTSATKHWQASSGLSFHIPVPSPTTTLLLPVSGIRVSAITSTAATYAEISSQFQLNSILSLLATTHATIFDDFWRALIKDTFRSQRPADAKQARKAFRALLAVYVWELQIAAQDSPSAYGALLTSTNSSISALAAREENGGLIPSLDEVEELIGVAKLDPDESREKREMDGDVDDFRGVFREACAGRRMVGVEGGRLGITAEGVKVGDVVWVLAGAEVPVVLREGSEKGRWRLVGDAFVCGIMGGEAVKGGKVEEIVLE
jgi:hypothetical protein